MIFTKKSETKLMDAIYAESMVQEGNEILISPDELLKKVDYSIRFNEENLKTDINNLRISHFFEYKIADNEGEPQYFITLLGPGQSYAIDKKAKKRRWVERIISGMIGGLASTGVKFLIELLKQHI